MLMVIVQNYRGALRFVGWDLLSRAWPGHRKFKLYCFPLVTIRSIWLTMIGSIVELWLEC